MESFVGWCENAVVTPPLKWSECGQSFFWIFNLVPCKYYTGKRLWPGFVAVLVYQQTLFWFGFRDSESPTDVTSHSFSCCTNLGEHRNFRVHPLCNEVGGTVATRVGPPNGYQSYKPPSPHSGIYGPQECLRITPYLGMIGRSGTVTLTPARLNPFLGTLVQKATPGDNWHRQICQNVEVLFVASHVQVLSSLLHVGWARCVCGT